VKLEIEEHGGAGGADAANNLRPGRCEELAADFKSAHCWGDLLRQCDSLLCRGHVQGYDDWILHRDLKRKQRRPQLVQPAPFCVENSRFSLRRLHILNLGVLLKEIDDFLVEELGPDVLDSVSFFKLFHEFVSRHPIGLRH
jgi:hypothetical protein